MRNVYHIICLVILITFFTKNNAQCFEIESVLVDACGNPEGENEMVRFSVGSTPLSTSDLSVSWATTMNPWLGVCQDAGTAQTTASLNATINSCGYLKEPIGGVLPAGAKVLLITSTDINVTFNSFDGLNDTLYIIYQCSGNTAGHFGNYGSSAIRTLSMSFSNPSGCNDVVSYNRNLLLNQNGIPGGSSAERDGGGVNFLPDGTASYYNNGCQAPIVEYDLSISSSSTAICPSDTINLIATFTHSNNIIWWGGNGSFSSQNSLNTYYYSASNDLFPLTIYGGYVIPCGDTIVDSVVVSQNSNTNISIVSSSNSICDGDTVTLTVNGVNNYTWNNGSNTQTINVDTAGTFYVYTNNCGNDTAFVDIAWNGVAPSVSLSGDSVICAGSSTLITASGDGPFTWYDGSIGSIHSVSSAQSVFATVSNSCGTDTAYMSVSISGSPPVASITGDLYVCDSVATTLTASGGDSYIWHDGTNAQTYSGLPSMGFLVAINNCGVDTIHFNIVDRGNSPIASVVGDTIVCDNKPSLFVANGGDSYKWNNGVVGDTYNSNNFNNIYVIAYNQCGEDTAFVNLNNQSVFSNFELNDSVGNSPLSVVFTNLSQNATDYIWDLGNNNISTNINEEYVYTESGEFVIKLVSKNNYCSDTSYKTVKVLSNHNIFIPNSFSPNGDYINDYFFPVLSDISEEDYNFIIFDRNGGVVFNSTDIEESWDGIHINKNVPNGVYVWKIIYKVNNELQKREKYGHVTLIR